MIETEAAAFRPASPAVAATAGASPSTPGDGAAPPPPLADVDDSPLAALDKLVASATAGANAGAIAAAEHQRRLMASGSDENSGAAANNAAVASSAPSSSFAGSASASASASPGQNPQTVVGGPSTPGGRVRGGHTGSYVSTPETNGRITRSSPGSQQQQLHAQSGAAAVVSGKPPTAGAGAHGHGHAHSHPHRVKKSSAGARSVGSEGAGGPPAATLSSASSSPGQMSRDGSTGGGVGAVGIVAATAMGAAAAMEVAPPPASTNGGGAVPKPPRGRDGTQQQAAAPGTAAPQSSSGPMAIDTSGGGGGNNAFLVPMNPRDTVPSSSPKRRSRSATRGAASGASPPVKSVPSSSGGRSLSGASQVSASSSAANPPPPPPPNVPPVANVSPTRSYASSSYAQLSLPSSPQGSGAGVAYLVDTASGTQPSSAQKQGPSDIVRRSDPDSEEQTMFEQRLCEDEYGVAVRKINSNGRSQLRYVKCVPLSSAEYDERGRLIAGSPALDRHGGGSSRAGTSVASATRSVTSSTARSVSSLMGRIGRGRRSDRSRSGRDRSVSVERKVVDTRGAAVGGGGGSARHLASDSPSQSSGAPYGAIVDGDPEHMRTLLSSAPGRRRLALTWGNKKKVKLGLDRFVCVRKGKTTERTRRNPCHPSRLLSLVTDDRANPSLDIEAPTKLDRDKFARAFARFLGVPLEADSSAGDEASDVGGTSVDLEGKKRRSSSARKERFSAAHSAPDLSPSVKSIRSSRSASTDRSSRGGGSSAAGIPQTPERDATAVGLLPAMSQSPSASEDLKFTFNQDVPLDPYKGARGAGDHRLLVAGSASTSQSSSNVELLSDAAMQNLSSLGRRNEDEEEPNLLDGPPDQVQKQASSIAAGASAVPSTQAVNNSVRPSSDPVGPDGHHLNHHQHRRDKEDKAEGQSDNDACTDVSSLTQGFDQEIVEELHQALTELRAELEASRAEAARAVKVAEQAIQSAESCSSNDWNSTVTHKAAEAAAQAQKKSAEAMARQRAAEEKLAAERKTAQFWRRQAEAAEEEVGALTTRAAAAEVQRAAMAAELEGNRRRAQEDGARLREERSRMEKARAVELVDASERNRVLEIELDKSRRDLAIRSKEAKSLHETLTEIKNNPAVVEKSGGSVRKKLSFGRSSTRKKHQRGQSLLGADSDIVRLDTPAIPNSTSSVCSINGKDGPISEKALVKVHAEASQLRTELDILRRTAAEEIAALPVQGKEWVGRVASAMTAAQAEAQLLREKLARETAMRRKLSNEVQDLRGNVRVFCCPRSTREHPQDHAGANCGILSATSHDILQLDRNHGLGSKNDSDLMQQPVSFEFDHVFSPDCMQKDVYLEVEELVLCALDGYNVCLMAYGPRGCGKTHTLIGDCSVSLGDEESGATVDINEFGVHFMAAEQLFSISEHRRDRYQDSVTITIVEVHNERLRDLLVGTDIAEVRGQVQGGDAIKEQERRGKRGRNKGKDTPDDDANNSNSSQQGNSTGSKSGKPGKLEIRTTYDGDTVVQGLISVPVKTFDDICQIWKECLVERAARLAERGINAQEYEGESHVIATINVVSTNIATGVGTVGKIQFADLASADLVPKRNASASAGKSASSAKPTPLESVLSGIRNDGTEWKFANRSLGTLLDVVSARCQFSRSVPYRNSTITHLLRDSLTADTKVLLLVCVSNDSDNLQETASALRFAAQMRRVAVGKATKHTVSSA